MEEEIDLKKEYFGRHKQLRTLKGHKKYSEAELQLAERFNKFLVHKNEEI